MTCKDIGDFCLCQQNKEHENVKMMAYIGYKSTERLLRVFGSKKPKDISFVELYPEFDEKKQFNQLNEEQKDKLIALKWREFLGK